MRTLVSLLAVGLLAACSRSGVAPEALTTEDVGGQYEVCSLRFVPDGGFPPAVDIRAGEMDLAAQRQPLLALSRRAPTFELEYTPKDDDLPRRLSSEYRPGRAAVTLVFTDAQSELRRLLLPSELELDFSAAPRRLTISDRHHSHSVARVDYERIAGESRPNVSDPIRGRLEGSFSVSGC